MRAHHNLKPFLFAVFIAAIIQLYLAYHSLGGIDVGRYWSYAYSADLAEPYYLKEIASWGIIRAASTYFDRVHFLFALAMAMLLIGAVLIGPWRSPVLYASFLSPFGVLLEFNVLRQSIGTLFVAVAFLYLLRGRIIWFAGCSIIAVLSHNSSIIILAAVVAVYLYVNLSPSYRPLMVVSTAVALLFMQLLGILDAIMGEKANSLLANIDDGPENIAYAVASLFYCFLLYIMNSSRRFVAIGLGCSVVAFSTICYMFDLEAWVYGRIALSNIVIATFLLFEAHINEENPKSVQSLACYVVLVANGLLIFAHPGAISMIG